MLMTTETVLQENETLGADWSPGASHRRKRHSASFLRAQRQRLLALREALADSVAGVARLSRENSVEAPACSQHPADGGSDACDRDFALRLLSHEQNALSEVDQALQRIARGTYGVCELSGEPIPRARLEAIPFTRHTVARQAQIEREKKSRSFSLSSSQPIASPDDRDGEREDSQGSETESVATALQEMGSKSGRDHESRDVVTRRRPAKGRG